MRKTSICACGFAQNLCAAVITAGIFRLLGGLYGARRVASGARLEDGLVGATGRRAPTLTMPLAMTVGLTLTLS